MSSVLMATSALILFMLGAVHLLYTFSGNRLTPRDATLQAHMRIDSPVLTRETTMWNAWVGFNASHSFGAMLYGLVFGYLAIAHATMLFASPFLLAVGLCLLGGYAFLGKRYWFTIPYRGILAATLLYVAALVLAV